MKETWRYIPREKNGRFAHYVPIIEPRRDLILEGNPWRRIFIFGIGMLFGAALVVGFYLACVVERAAEATQGPENGAIESMNTMDVNVPGVWGKNGFPVKAETLNGWVRAPYKPTSDQQAISSTFSK